MEGGAGIGNTDPGRNTNTAAQDSTKVKQNPLEEDIIDSVLEDDGAKQGCRSWSFFFVEVQLYEV